MTSITQFGKVYEKRNARVFTGRAPGSVFIIPKTILDSFKFYIKHNNMSRKDFPSRPRVVSGNLHKYVSRLVTIVGEVVALTPAAGTFSLNMTDGSRMIVLLPKNNATTIENNLLTEVYGTLVSKGQVEAMWIKQYTQRETAMFNKSLYQEAGDFLEANRSYYDV